MRRLLAVTLALGSLVGWRYAQAEISAPVGYVGCSNTTLAVLGYHAEGGQRLWSPAPTTYYGGTIVRWASSSWGWQQYQGMSRADPGADTVWLQPCILSTETVSASELALAQVVAKLHAAGIRSVYGSAINGYADSVCWKIGPGGFAKSQQVIDWGEAAGLLEPGPLLPALTRAQLQSDGCHPNTEGQHALGRALLEFFS